MLASDTAFSASTNRQIEDLIASKLVTREQVRAAGLQVWPSKEANAIVSFEQARCVGMVRWSVCVT